MPAVATTSGLAAQPTMVDQGALISVEASGVAVDETLVKYLSRRITFIARVTPQSAQVQGVLLRYTYPKDGSSFEQVLRMPPQKLNVQTEIQYSLDVARMPKGEDSIEHEWFFDTPNGKISSGKQAFRITEVIATERKDWLPVIDAELNFQSRFPDEAIFSAVLTPESPINQAYIFYTQNGGLASHRYQVKVPLNAQPGEKITLTFNFTDFYGLQIPWQQFEWWFELRDKDNRVWRTQPRYDAYADEVFHNWTRTETKHSVMFTYERSTADIQYLANYTDSAYEKAAASFGYDLLYRPHIVIYNTPDDFQAWAPPAISDRFIGMASGEWGGAVVTFYDTLQYTGTVIQHELIHLFQYQSVRKSAPKWWMEGSATYFEGEADGVDEVEVVRRIARLAYPPDFRYRIPDEPPAGSYVPYPYYAGSTFITFLIEQHGLDAFQQVHVAMAKDEEFVDALVIATGKTLADLNSEFADWITQ
ncbi:MAG: hypothetical protein OHK0023_09850 [Anaerolineae bacterium]